MSAPPAQNEMNKPFTKGKFGPRFRHDFQLAYVSNLYLDTDQ